MDLYKFLLCIFVTANFNLKSSKSQEYSISSGFLPSQRAHDRPPDIDYSHFKNTQILNSTSFHPNPDNLLYKDGESFSPSYNLNNRLPVQAYGAPGSGGQGELVENAHNRYIPTTSTSISGDYCWDPLFNCDTANTILYCINGRCTCPTGWTIAPGNLPLNTVWHPAAKRCVSLIGSGCHTAVASVASGYVYCQPGVRCIPHPKYREVGTCGSSNLKVTIAVLLFPFYYLIMLK